MDKKVLLKAIEYLKTPHEVSADLAEVPGFVLMPLDFFKPDFRYWKHYDQIQKKNITADKMSLKNIRTMFTFFNRGERFSRGFTADIINSGELLSVYKRLEELL